MDRESLSVGDTVPIPTVGVGYVALFDDVDTVVVEPYHGDGEYIVPYAVAVEWAHYH